MKKLERSLREEIIEIGRLSKLASRELAIISSAEKNEILKSVGKYVSENMKSILAGNEIDIKNGKEMGLSEGLIDRLYLDEGRVQAMVNSIEQIIGLEDPIGEIEDYGERTSNR